MKKKIHPEYKETTIACACGEVIHTRSTRENMRVDICSKCHPFFTGQQKLIESAGMVEKFKKRYAGKSEHKKTKAAKPQEKKRTERPLSEIKEVTPEKTAEATGAEGDKPDKKE